MDDAIVRRNLTELLEGGSAHLTLDQAIKGLPPALRARRPSGHLKSVWELLEHLRIAQHDLLHYMTDPGWQSPPWPDGYWPDPPEVLPEGAWQETLDGFREDHRRILELVNNPNLDLTSEVPGGQGHTFLRELLLVADHNAYHLGQMVDTRRRLGAWKE
ncbi:MAG TPA: DinB family protein [Trueperaceae bacterium]